MELVRDLQANGHIEALSLETPDARLVVAGDPFWLRRLIGEILDLGGASRQPTAPSITLKSHARGSALSFSWPRFRKDAVGALHMALIDALARLHGAAAILTPSGLRLRWPHAQLAAPEALSNGSIQAVGAEPANAAGEAGLPRSG
jgi:hypothetical protein